jgi:glycosyltransferase involved in cell wall biosynthesis
MRVAIFTDNDFEKVNGVTTTLRAVLEHAPDDIDVRVYTCDGEGLETPDYLALPAFGFGIPFYREMKIYAPPLRRILRHAVADGIDLVHLTTPGPVGLAARWVASRLQVPIIGSFHTDLATYTRMLSGSKRLGQAMETYMRWAYGRCERVFVPSLATRDMLIRARISPTHIDVWRRGVSNTLFNPARRSAELRERWGVSADRPALLYVGRVSREKGLSLLRPLSRFLEYAGVAHRLVIVGDGPMRSALAASCPDAIFTGTMTPDGVATAMASADLFVFPSETDTAGNVVLEAQASGLPVLVSRIGGPSENMRHGDTGFACGDLTDFARRAAQLLRNAGRRSEYSEAARRYAMTRSWESALEPLYRAYACDSPQEADISEIQERARSSLSWKPIEQPTHHCLP